MVHSFVNKQMDVQWVNNLRRTIKDQSKEGRMKGSFVSNNVFNLSKKVLSQPGINVLGLGFSPTLSFINEVDLRRYFNKFSRKMRCK